MVVAFLVVFVVQQSSCRGLIGLLSRFLVELRVKVLEELIEAYRACFLKSFNFGQNAVNPCVKSFDVVAHDGLAHFFAKLPLIERSGQVALVSATAS